MTDGLVSNTALIAGVAGGGAASRTVLLAGLAGLAAGAFSMATGEYVSVASQTELTLAEIEIEKAELAPGARGRGGRAGRHLPRPRVTRTPPREVARQLSADPEQVGACTPARSSASTRTTCPRRGSRPARRSSPSRSARSSRVLPYLLGGPTCSSPCCWRGVALFGAGRGQPLHDRAAVYGGLRRLLLGSGAATADVRVGELAGRRLAAE